MPMALKTGNAEYVNKTRILTCMLEHLNRKKVLRANTFMQNVLKQQIPPRNFTEERRIAVGQGYFRSVRAPPARRLIVY